MLPSCLPLKTDVCSAISKEAADEEHQCIRLSLLGHLLQESLLEYSIKHSHHIYCHHCDLLVPGKGCFNIMSEGSHQIYCGPFWKDTAVLGAEYLMNQSSGSNLPCHNLLQSLAQY